MELCVHKTALKVQPKNHKTQKDFTEHIENASNSLFYRKGILL